MKTPATFKTVLGERRCIAAVVAHTHWDRAWYHSFEQFRLALCKVTRRLLEILETDRRYRHFTFDGQTVVLEDYLELFPQDRPRIEALVRAGRLTVGPFYVLPDFFLITGESHIRNGKIGQEIAESFGRSSRQGYVADPFGLVSQTPAIFEGLGIESILFSRGVSREQLDRAGSTFWWAAPGGAGRILAILQVNGYSNLMNFGVPLKDYPHDDPDTDAVDFDHAAAQVRQLLGAYAGVGVRSKVLFFGNGNDHHGPSHRLPDLLAHVAAAVPDVAFVQTDTDGLVDLIRQERPALKTLRGQLHGAGAWATLNGTLESRFYLKQQYDEAAGWLEKRAEPLTALAQWLGLEGRFLREQHHHAFAFNVGNDSALPLEGAGPALRQAWKTLLRNAPHDDLCGCSVDATHADAENRAKRVVEMASMLSADAALRLAGSLAAPAFPVVARLVAHNGLSWPRTAAIDRTMRLPAASAALRVVDGRGRPVPATVRARVVAEGFRRWNSLDFQTLPTPTVEARVALSAALPAGGYKTFYLVAGRAAAPDPAALRRRADGMENDHVRVRLHADGAFDLHDQRTDRTYRRLHQLRDTGEAGSLYVSRLLAEGVATPSPRHGRLACVEALPDRVTFRLRLRLPAVPVGLTPDRRARSRQAAPMDLTFHYTLYAHSPAVHVRAEWVNAHRDHRLTVAFPTALATDRLAAHATLDVVEHAAPARQLACRDFVSAAAGGARLTILSRSLHSADAWMERGRLVIGKCLLRASGWINESLIPYWGADGGNCLRPVRQEYAVLAGAEGDSWYSLAAQAAELNHEPLVEHYTDPPRGSLPEEASFVRIEAPFEMTAWKRCDDRPTLIVRAVNLSPAAATLRLEVSPLLGVRRAWRTDLRERRGEALAVRAGAVRCRARSRQIVTVELSR